MGHSVKEEPATLLVGPYPPPVHLLRDLGISLSFHGRERATLSAPVAPAICDRQGAVLPGVLATLVDVLGGSLAIRAIWPDWIVTSDLSVHASDRPARGRIAAEGSLLRSGRNKVIIEADLFEEHGQGRGRVGYAMITLSRIRRAGEPVPVEAGWDSESTFTFAGEGAGFERSCREKMGVAIVAEPAGGIEVPMTEYVRNSFGALQGGVVAILADLAGEGAAGMAGGCPFVTRALQVHYLSPGRTGPFRATARLLDAGGDSALTRVEVADRGDGDRLIAVALNRAAACR